MKILLIFAVCIFNQIEAPAAVDNPNDDGSKISITWQDPAVEMKIDGYEIWRAEESQDFEKIADKSKVPILAYNIPQNTFNNIPPRVIHQLADHPNILGLKDSWGDMFQFQEYLTARSEKFSIFMGPNSGTHPVNICV